MDKDQRIRDPIHNLISFSNGSDEDRILWELVGTEAVQRLRRIKQLGFSEYVYPGATHTRFSHALGSMQMARRMLDVFEKRAKSLQNGGHDQRRLATLSAALLHDIGHGPYSHVFEELCEYFNLEKGHEEYTAELIQDTEIAAVLSKADILQETAEFFKTEKTNTAYTTIISSQLDCDRLDFLSRDRYYTGIQSSYIDLAWLFDSMHIEEVCIEIETDARQFSFVIDEKGLRVAEEYVIAYMKMYQDVYFHKTTRAVQHLVTELIKRAVEQFGQDKSLSSNNLMAFLTKSDCRSTCGYLKMDDSDVISLIHVLADGKYFTATDLARRYLCRDLFKCLEIKPIGGELPRQKIRRFIEKLRDRGLYFKIDLLKSRSYKQYEVSDRKFLENILIKQADEHFRLHQVSALVRRVPEEVARFYFWNQDDKRCAASILNSC